MAGHQSCLRLVHSFWPNHGNSCSTSLQDRGEDPCYMSSMHTRLQSFYGGCWQRRPKLGILSMPDKIQTKFRIYIYFFLKDVCITNSYILYNLHSPTKNLKNGLSFRLQLSKELIGILLKEESAQRRDMGRPIEAEAKPCLWLIFQCTTKMDTEDAVTSVIQIQMEGNRKDSWFCLMVLPRVQEMVLP